MNITIIGTGFVGVVSAAVYASFGNNVIGLDIDPKKINSLKLGKVPFFEPKLEDLLIQQQNSKNLTFTTSYEKAIADAQIVIIAVGTPSLPSGAVDLTYIKQACEDLAPHLKENTIVVIKSTVPPGIFKEIKPIIASKTKVNFYLAALPEFLKEGTAVDDTLNPDRIVIGAIEETVINQLTKLHQPFNAPIVTVKPESAQMIKYTANAYLATRITFINQIADLCEHNGADINDVIEGIGYDKRIGHHYWYPGLGYGGSCFPKDVNELASYAKKVKEDKNLVITIGKLNEQRIPKLLNKYSSLIGGWKNKTIGILGISFKPNTNDTREAPALKIIPELLNKGSIVNAFDPKAIWSPSNNSNYTQAKTAKEAINKADCIMVLVEWPEFINYKFPKVEKPTLFIDTRNLFEAEKLSSLGYTYQGIGR